MLEVMSFVLIGLIGLALGSFVNALVWRMHEQEVAKGKRQKEKARKELSILNGRSMCVHCKHTLAWYDLIPVFSWLSLKGKCRYCKKPISSLYPIVELFTAVALVISYIYWPFGLSGALSYVIFGVWTIILTILIALTVYDFKWMILPTKLITILFVLSALFTLLLALEESSAAVIISSLAGSFGLGGLFWLIYQISKGKWIGGGDVRFGFAMGLLLGWQKSIFALTAAAYIGLAVIIVLVILGKYHRKMRLPFGPMLIVGTYVSLLWGQYFIDLYKDLSGL